MDIWNRIKNSAELAAQQLLDSWKAVSSSPSSPVSFANLPDNERAILEPIHQNFLEKAQRGYFDEDIERSYKRFLRGCAFETSDIENSAAYMRGVAKAAIPENRKLALRVQDRFWLETGLTDTREHPLIPHTRDY